MSSRYASHQGRDIGRGRGPWFRGRANLGRSGRTRTLPPLELKVLGPTIDSISINTLLTEEDAPTVKGVEYIGSYNWVGGKSPVILVPGSPPAWTPLSKDRKLKPDSEDVFRDINAARYASYPLEPTVRSIQAMRPTCDLQAVDIIGCGSTLGNLLRFAGSLPRPFHFDVDVIGDTVFFIRKESSPTELISDLQGYGHTFPEAYTTWDPEVRGSCSHQRIIQYEFGGLKFLIRTETDGYVREAGTKNPFLDTGSDTKNLSLNDALGTMAVSNSTEVAQNQQLELKTQGISVRQDQIFDIKTRASHKPFNMEEILPRLWLNQTPKFLIAYHEFGLFNKPEVKDISQEIMRWESSNSARLARFHAVVKRIVDVVRDSKQQQCEVSWDGKGNLNVTRQIGEGRRALPSHLWHLLEVS